MPEHPSSTSESERANSREPRPRDLKRPPDEPTAAPDPTDEASETDLWVGRTSWKYFAGAIARWLAVLAVVSGLLLWFSGSVEWLGLWRAMGLVTGLAIISGTVVLGRIGWRILGTRYRLTTQRLFIERGILSQTIDQTELVRVDDVRVHKRLFDRLFGLGTVEIVTTDATDSEISIEGVHGPDEVAEAVRSNMRTLRRKSLYIETL